MSEYIIGVLTGIIIGILVMGKLIPQEKAPQDNPEARVYCEMRKIFDDTNGDFGWPNYRSEIECINGEVK
jgi:hypothetical protein